MAFESRTFNAGQRIFREGEEGDCAFLIKTGQIEISKANGMEQITIAVLGPGEIIGEMALIDSCLRSGTARAVTDVELIVVPREEMTKRMDQVDLVTKRILVKYANIIRNQNRVIAKGGFNALRLREA